MQSHYDAMEQRRRLQDVDLVRTRPPTSPESGEIACKSLTCVRCGSIRIDASAVNCFGICSDDGRRAANAQCKRQQNNPEVTPQDRFEPPQRDRERFELAGGVVQGHEPHRAERIAASFG